MDYEYIQIIYVRQLRFEWNMSCRRASLRKFDDRPVSENVIVEEILIRGKLCA